MRIAKLAAAIVVLVLTTSSCDGGSDEPASTAENTLASLSREPGNVLPTDAAVVDAKPVRLSGWEAVGDEVIRVHFSAGTSECFGASVDVEESDESIRVAVSVGSIEAAASTSCAAIALDSSVEIPLDAPVGERPIVDTNAGA